MKDRIEELAKECGIHERHSNPNELWCYKRNIHAFANAIHNEALELAAKHLDDNWYKTQSDAAAAIRKLKVSE